MADKKQENIEEIEQDDEIIDPPEIDSKYRMIILAAQRSKQLQRGANSRTDIDTRKSKPTCVADERTRRKACEF